MGNKVNRRASIIVYSSLVCSDKVKQSACSEVSKSDFFFEEFAIDIQMCKSSIFWNESDESIARSLDIETFDDKMILPLFGVITGNAPVFQHFTHGIRSLPIWRRIERQIHAQLVGKISYLKELELSKRKGSGDDG